MLERTSTCLEPAAQNLLRSIEAPTRSQRRLPHAFWRYTRTTQDPSSWWPAYLDDIRRATQARECAFEHVTSIQRSGVLPFALQQWTALDSGSAPSNPNRQSGTRRHISKIVKQSRKKEDKVFQDALEDNDEPSQPAEVEIFAPDEVPERSSLPFLQEKTPSQRLLELLRASGEPRYGTVWHAFISLKEQASLARPVLRYLSRSTSREVLRRALRAFQMIEVENRTHLTYESAVRTAIGLRIYDTANRVVLEALERGLGNESSQYLMGHLVEKGMWKSAIEALRVFKEHAQSKSDNHNVTNPHVLQNLQEAPLWKTVDRLLTLPQKLLRLCTRLNTSDAVLALDRAEIEHLATRLLERCLRSSRIMAVITPSGVLSLLAIYHELKLLTPEHYLDALSALRELRDSRNRSQLALLIFRNMRWRYPDRRFRDSTYGTMISILSAAPNDPDAFDYILKDVTVAPRGIESVKNNRKVDLAMYQRVMSACAEQGHTTYIKRSLKKMIADHGVPSDLAYFTPLLLSSAKRGDVGETKRAFEGISAVYGLKPEAQCWNILLLSYAKADDFIGAAAVFEQMQQSGVATDSYTFGTLMSMCSNAGDTQAVLQLVDMARKQHIPATSAMVDTIVHSYCMNEEVREAESLVEAATQMELSGTPTRMWNTLLRHYAFRGDSASILRIQERMRELAVRPDGMTYAALMTSLVVMGKTAEAAAILRSLHLGQVFAASKFHYSIVFHGFVQENNRDMAMVIYTEMLERFSTPSPSARLAMMHLQNKRDELRARSQDAAVALVWDGGRNPTPLPQQVHSIDYLAGTLLEMADLEGLQNEPQPGFRRRKAIFASPAVYLEVAVATLNLASSYEKAKELLSRYKAMINDSKLSKQQKSYQNVQLDTAQMRGLVRSFQGSGLSTAHMKQQSRARIDAIWTRIFDKTASSSSQRLMDLSDNTMEGTLHKGIPTQPPAAVADAAASTPNLDTMPSSQRDLSSLVVGDSVKALPAKRYALSVPLSTYMRGLAIQNRHTELEGLVQQVQQGGFELTSKNWNTYVQLLSEKKETVSQAFRTFERKLLPYAPPWQLLKRGVVLFSPVEQRSGTGSEARVMGEKTASRTTLEKRHPDRLMPTYYTAIHLAGAFIKAYRANSQIGSEVTSLYDELRLQAPGTVKFVEKMPYIKDRVQGVLLRGRAVKGDPVKTTRKLLKADRAGLLGSRATRGMAKKQYPDGHDPQSQHVKETFSDEQFESISMNTNMVASDSGGEPHVEGLPPQNKGTARARRRHYLLRLEQEGLTGSRLSNSATHPRSTFEKRVEALRDLAEKPELRHHHRRLTSRLNQTPRIKAFVSKHPDQLLPPMGHYKHRDPRFTKPMLAMKIPRRRQLRSERRTWDIPKKYRALQVEREREMRIAQARRKTMLRQKRRLAQEERAPQGFIEPLAGDDAAFLERRLIVSEVQDRQEAMQEATHILLPESRPRDDMVAAGRYAQQKSRAAEQADGPDAFERKHFDPRRKGVVAEDRVDTPFGPVEGFDVEDFVKTKSSASGSG